MKLLPPVPPSFRVDVYSVELLSSARRGAVRKLVSTFEMRFVGIRPSSMMTFEWREGKSTCIVVNVGNVTRGLKQKSLIIPLQTIKQSSTWMHQHHAVIHMIFQYFSLPNSKYYN